MNRIHDNFGKDKINLSVICHSAIYSDLYDCSKDNPIIIKDNDIVVPIHCTEAGQKLLDDWLEEHNALYYNPYDDIEIATKDAIEQGKFILLKDDLL